MMLACHVMANISKSSIQFRPPQGSIREFNSLNFYKIKNKTIDVVTIFLMKMYLKLSLRKS